MNNKKELMIQIMDQLPEMNSEKFSDMYQSKGHIDDCNKCIKNLLFFSCF